MNPLPLNDMDQNGFMNNEIMGTHWEGCEKVDPEYAKARKIRWEPKDRRFSGWDCDGKNLVDAAYDQFLQCTCGSTQFKIRAGPYIMLATCCLCFTEAEIYSG